MNEITTIVELFQSAGYTDVQAYRYNSAVIRLRIRDSRFKGVSRSARIELLEPLIEQLPEEIQEDLIFVLPIAPGEENTPTPYGLMDFQFRDPEGYKAAVG